ncbi:Homeobox KN domain [Dillenia turbinata]|uniref:Homeobox KN domain n=1 Tax=Dillenia turbinata TaxID=194707 RepID=A0AAN8UMG4_9MAGN
MENNIFDVPIEMPTQSSMAVASISSRMFSPTLDPLDVLDSNSQNQIMTAIPMFPTLQGEPLNYVHGNLHWTNGGRIVNSDVTVSRDTFHGRISNKDASAGSLHTTSDARVLEGFADETSISAPPVANSFATRSPRESLNDFANTIMLPFSAEASKTCTAQEFTNTSNSPFATPVTYGYDGIISDMNNKWEISKFLMPEFPVRGPFTATRYEPFPCVGSGSPNSWMSSNSANMNVDHPYGSISRSELSLSLATSQPPIICGTSIPDLSSEVSCSGVTYSSKGLGSDQTSCNNNELSLSFTSYRPSHLSSMVSESKYLHVIQEILAEIASYALENVNLEGTGMFSSALRGSGIGSCEYPSRDGGLDGQMEPMLQGHEAEAKKMHLLALLQAVDDRYHHCSDQIHKVISAFHAATELSPQIHAQFALQSISFLYKNLRERISKQILAVGENLNSGFMRDKDRSFESSFIQKQWALQQLRRKDHQSWRPQRGLPERSVSVLRAWMFQNFLHPYPKDAEKHLLAIKSGLSRNQVSNWFINARVRLWKPLIEEMYSEMNGRKGHGKDEGTNSSHRSCTGAEDWRFQTN